MRYCDARVTKKNTHKQTNKQTHFLVARNLCSLARSLFLPLPCVWKWRDMERESVVTGAYGDMVSVVRCNCSNALLPVSHHHSHQPTNFTGALVSLNTLVFNILRVRVHHQNFPDLERSRVESRCRSFSKYYYIYSNTRYSHPRSRFSAFPFSSHFLTGCYGIQPNSTKPIRSLPKNRQVTIIYRLHWL